MSHTLTKTILNMVQLGPKVITNGTSAHEKCLKLCYVIFSLLQYFESFVPEFKELKAVENEKIQSNSIPQLETGQKIFSHYFQIVLYLIFFTSQKIMKQSITGNYRAK